MPLIDSCMCPLLAIQIPSIHTWPFADWDFLLNQGSILVRSMVQRYQLLTRHWYAENGISFDFLDEKPLQTPLPNLIAISHSEYDFGSSWRCIVKFFPKYISRRILISIEPMIFISLDNFLNTYPAIEVLRPGYCKKLGCLHKISNVISWD